MHQQQAFKNTLKTAVRQISAVQELDNKLVKSDNKNKLGFGSSYRTRARMIPSMVFETGLLSTLGYLYAKAKDTYKKVFKATNPETSTINIETLKDERGNLPGIEELAHAVYLHHILSYVLSTLNLEGQETDPLTLLKRLAENPSELILAEAMIKPYLIELKHLAEAVLEEKTHETRAT